MKKSFKFIYLISIIFTLLFINFSWTLINVKASPERYHRNFNNENAELAWKINDNTYGDMENLAITYYMGAGTCLIRGVRYKYNNVGMGPYQVEIRYVGDTMWVSNLDTNIPHVTSDSWRTLRNIGPIYLLDDDPEIHFIGRDPSDDCISLCADSPSYGHSYYDIGSGWTLDTQYEYMAEVIYEWVEILPIGEKKTGAINATDNIDAYFISLEAGIDYKFVLERISGSGNLNIRLVTYQDLTNDVLAQSSENLKLEFLSYTPVSTNIYVLLVEAQTVGLDMANYSIVFYKELSPILIDDNGGGDYTWAEAELEHWCSGSGDPGDPYVIENVIIDAKLASYCLYIRDSVNPYFVVRNSWFFNASYGIYLGNANYGQLINNIITNCTYGIRTYGSLKNLNLSGNQIFNSSGEGVRFGLVSGNSSFTGNIIFNNGGDGIYAYSMSGNNIISNNTIYNNNGDGIYIDNSAGSNLLMNNNNIYNNIGDGIQLDGSYNGKIINNMVHDNQQKGMWITSTSTLNFSNNRVIYNKDTGVEISSSGNNYVFNKNEISYNLKDGINAIISNSNITTNTISYNGNNGMVISGDNNYFWNNSIIKNSNNGVKALINSNSFTINKITYNGNNGMVISGDDNYFWNNSIIKNSNDGLKLSGNHNGIYFNNFTSNLMNGLNITDGETYISKNDITYNLQNGIITSGGYNSISGYNNILYNGLNGIHVINAEDNSLTFIRQNKIISNKGNGILLMVGGDHDGGIAENIISDNIKSGIYILSNTTSEIIVRNNNITNNLEYGICIENASNTIVYANHFIGNTINALDNGTNNFWNSSTIGNYWDDYSSCGPYLIPGSSGAKDYHPVGYIACPQPPPPLKLITIEDYYAETNSPFEDTFSEGDTIKVKKGQKVYFMIQLSDGSSIPFKYLEDATVILEIIGADEYEFDQLSDGEYKLAFKTDKYDTFFGSKTLKGTIKIEKEGYYSIEIEVKIIVEPETGTGVPSFYFVLFSSIVAALVGVFVVYQLVKKGIIKKWFKRIRSDKNNSL